MRINYFKISGGAMAHIKNTKIPRITGVLFAVLLLYSSPAFGQGSIFGTVTNSDASVPVNGQISFYGFLDNTDEEIRIESCVGAGYDAGNWFDDFQNYLTEAPGNPYAYYFYNSANGEGAILSKLIPNNSFQQENILLAPVSWPAKPSGLSGQAVSSSSVVITWDDVPGLTYHVYRRAATSNGSFFRIDNPAGSLANPGVAHNFYVDNGVDGVSSYSYMIIPQNGTGNLGPHSDILAVNSGTLSAPVIASIVPDSGSMYGGTAVTITGSEFDMNGVTVSIGTGLLSSVVVVSPFEITGLTPSSPSSGLADVVVTNSASGLPSNTLTGGFNFLLNSPPILSPIGPRSTTEGVNLNFAVTASDPDGTTPALFTSTLPGAATFTDNLNGTGTFDWTPSFTDVGIYVVTFYAADAIDTVFEDVTITVGEAGNQPPVLDSIGPKTVAEASNLNFIITSSDPDGDTPSLSATDVPANATFTDNLDGTGTFDFNPDYTQAGILFVTFKAFDGIAVDSEIVEITVTNTNQPPILASIGPKLVDEGVNLNFAVTASDADGTLPVLSTSTLPGTATFVDNLNGTGTFDWTPGFTESGGYNVTFYATDGIDTDSELVVITVNDAGNQFPVLDSIGPLFAVEGGTLIRNITASDPDGDTPQLFADSLPANAAFVDSGNGVGTFTFNPDYEQSGTYNVIFYASDGLLADSELVLVTVSESGNQAPVLSGVNDTLINEGDSLVLVVTASDPDGPGVLLSASSSLARYNFVDSGNGVGVFSFYATYFDAGVDSIWFSAFDLESPPAVTTTPMALTIADVNQPPVLDSIGPFGVVVDDTLIFTVTATDSTDPIPGHRIFLSAVGVPAHASFVDNANNTGTFRFYPDSTQIGVITVTFIAADVGTPRLTDNLPVQITVVRVNRPPVLTVQAAYTVWEGQTLSFTASATDPDGTIPVLSAAKLPSGAAFTDNADGTGTFSWTPTFIQSGLYGIIVSAYDGIAVTKKNVLIQVYEAGNQEPIVNPVPAQSVTEGDTISILITATDPDGSIPALYADSLPENATFTDSGNGSGSIDFNPSYVQSGTYNVYIMADDGELVDTFIVVIVVEEAGNQGPDIINPGQFQANEGETVHFTVTSTDLDMTPPFLTAGSLPQGATFVDNHDFTGTFNWVTGYFDAGDHFIKFYATDSLDPGMIDSVIVLVRIVNVNRPPYIYVSGSSPYSLNEGQTLNILIYATDPDSTIPHIEVHTPDYNLVPNMTFHDSANGVALFTFSPDYTQGGTTFLTYDMRWRAIDAQDPTLINPSFPVQIRVYNTNQPPELRPVNDTSIYEGDTLVIVVLATDGDGQIPVVSAENLPPNSTFTGPFNHTKTFTFFPDYTQSGLYTVRFMASDGTLRDTMDVDILVLEAGNQAPYFVTVLPDTQLVTVGLGFANHIVAEDGDLDNLVITVDTVLPHAVFEDSGNNAARYSYSPTLVEVGKVDRVRFFVTDPYGLTDTLVTHYRVVEFLRGDANGDSDLNMLDIMYLIANIYKGGPPPASTEAADVNFDGLLNLMDPVYLINFFYKGGPPPAF
jgi:hypothetical protein